MPLTVSASSPHGAGTATNSDGTNRAVDGPETLTCLGVTLTKRRLVVANENEYLEVRFVAGHSSIVPGPTSLFEDPLEHAGVQVKPAKSISNNEALVVYREKLTEATKCVEAHKVVTREIVRGPVLYKPQNASEWTHQFSWHGHDSSGDREQLARKRPHGLKFEKLLLAPSSTYFDVENVRTADDALLTVRLMIFFKLEDVVKMLDATNDPIADVINSVSSDVITFCAARSFEQFKETSEQLNAIGVYSALTSTVASRGIAVSKVVFRGFLAPQRLQKMHDDAIEKRTRLVLERESELQERKLADERLAKEQERESVKRQIESAEAEHRARLRRTEFEAAQRQKRDEAELHNAESAAEREHYQALQTSLGLQPAEIASLLVAKAHVPAKLIQISGDAKPVVHLDQ